MTFETAELGEPGSLLIVPAEMSIHELRFHIRMCHKHSIDDVKTYKRMVNEHADMHTPEWASKDTLPHVHQQGVTGLQVVKVKA